MRIKMLGRKIRKSLSICILLSLTTVSIRANASSNDFSVMLDRPADVYHQLWKNYHSYFLTSTATTDPEFEQAINGGEKLLKWLDLINSNRPSDQKLRVTGPVNPAEQPTPEKPNKMNPAIFKATFNTFLPTLPEKFRAVVYENNEITTDLPEGINESTFIDSAKKSLKLYSRAVRWMTVNLPYMDYYKKAKTKDIRGYYFLSKIDNLDQYLQNFDNLDEPQKQKTKSYLINICQNSGRSESSCERELKYKIFLHDVVNFKNYYWNIAVKNWNSYFNMMPGWIRKDVDWKTTNEEYAFIPYQDSQNEKVNTFLKNNLEDAYRNEHWNLQIQFTQSNSAATFVEFKEGVTPHADNSGGNSHIVMDKNISLDEYDAQWTIRHEFGHVLGLPDCYIEFYDTTEDAIIYYSLDPNDMMCAYSGQFTNRMFETLKQTYLH